MARRQWRSTKVAAAAAVVGLLLAACSDGDAETPTRLIDGSPARASLIEFEGVEVPVLVTLGRRGRDEPRCGLDHAQDAILVDRIGVAGASITAYSTSARTVSACDRTAGSWCGQAFARVEPDRPLDPRLSLTCERSDGDRVGFAWIEPRPATRYVVVTHDGYAEAYEAIGGLPVRVTTEDVDVTTSAARFDVSEHAADGRRVAAYRLVAQVAG